MEFTLPLLNQHQQNHYLQCAMQVLQAQQEMINNSCGNILQYILNKSEHFERMIHYPLKDRIDFDTGAQYFYHCHREDFESHEHGHFHCFIRYKNISSAIMPKMLDDWDLYIENPMTHLIAIALNQYGQPQRLFTVNRWVSSEIWYEAKHIQKFIEQFKLTHPHPYWSPLDRWIEGVLNIFIPQIDWLLKARDESIEKQIRDNPYLDKTLEELSSVDINLKKQIEWIIASQEQVASNNFTEESTT